MKSKYEKAILPKYETRKTGGKEVKNVSKKKQKRD